MPGRNREPGAGTRDVLRRFQSTYIVNDPAQRPSLVTMAFIFERYGPRLSIDQLAEVLSLQKKTLYNYVSAGTFPIKTYVDGGKRWADYRDVAEHFDAMRAQAR